MASPKISTSRRVLGDINSNINTSVHEPRHAPLISSTRKISASDKSSTFPIDVHQVGGTSTIEIGQENRQEINPDLTVESPRVGKGKVHQGRTATIDSLNSGTSLGLLNAKSIQWAGKKRSFAATDDNLEDIGTREGKGYSKKKRIELQPEESVKSTTTQQKHNCSQCSRTLLGHGIWTESSGLQVNGCGHENVGERHKFHGGIRRSSQEETSFASLISSFSTVEVEDIDITDVHPQASKVTMTDENSSKLINASTTRNLVTPKSKSLSREEIQQKSQALRLRLSLANYKVKTNQIDLPLSRLQIHSTSSNLPSLAHFRATSGNRTPLPGARTMNTSSKTSIPRINLQRPSSSSREGRIYVRKDEERENIRDEDVVENIPSSPPLLGSGLGDDRRDSAISCNSFVSKPSKITLNSRPGHAYPYALTGYVREGNLDGKLGSRLE